MTLLLFYSYQPSVMVTDMVPALLPTGVTSLLPSRTNDVDTHGIGTLLLGSVPGGWFGSGRSTRAPVLWPRRILCPVLLATSARMVMSQKARCVPGRSSQMYEVECLCSYFGTHSARSWGFVRVFVRFTPGAIETEYKAVVASRVNPARTCGRPEM
ncbi:MAG: hypothetical protein WB762_30295 [Candidatus Sulfotelmatobacter sp.]